MGKVCSFTGHRPEKMKMTEAQVKQVLRQAIEAAVADGFDTFVSGMAPGVDMWAAEIVLELKGKGHPLTLFAAVPYERFGQSKLHGMTERYQAVIEGCDRVEYISQYYHKGVFRLRDEYLVDHCQMLIAVFNGSEGGTKYTMDYAYKKGVPVKICEVE